MRYGVFLHLPYDEASFDCVTMWAVLEHVYAPRDYVAKVARLLKPGGRFVTLVTNFNSIQGRYYRADDYPRHLTMFTKSSYRRLMTSCGLEPGRMRTDQEIFGGSLYGALVVAAKRLGGYPAEEIYYEWRNSSDPLGFCCKWRGNDSTVMTWVSRADRMLSLPAGWLLDHWASASCSLALPTSPGGPRLDESRRQNLRTVMTTPPPVARDLPIPADRWVRYFEGHGALGDAWLAGAISHWSFSERLHGYIARFVPPKGRILHVGCGPGSSVLWLGEENTSSVSRNLYAQVQPLE